MRMLELRGSYTSRSVGEKILEKTDVLINEDVDEWFPGSWSGSPWINQVG